MTSQNNAFNWKTGERSIMWTQAGERVAKKMAGAGKCMDASGRPTVSLTESAKNGIVITSQAASDRTSSIRRSATC